MSYLLNFMWGVCLGAAYLAMLWGSVKVLLGHPQGARYHVVLAPVRFAVLAAGFVLLMRQGALAAVVALAGVVTARVVVTRHARTSQEVQP